MKKIYVILSVLFLATVLCSCINQRKSSDINIQNEEEQVVLTFFGNINATEKIRALEELIHDYMEEHPNVTIIYEGADATFTVDYNGLLRKRLSTGNGDDIMLSYAGYLPTLAREGYLARLDSLDSWKEYREDDKSSLSVNNHYYGIPLERTVIGLYCNMELLQKYNLEVPGNYQELSEACDILSKHGVIPITASQLLPFSGYAYADGLSRLYRSEDAIQRVEQIGNGQQSPSQYFEEGFFYLSELLEKGYIDQNATLAADNTEYAEKSFANGECAFLLGASDLNVSINHYNAALNYQIYPIPVSDGEGVVLTSPDHLLCVNENSKNRDTAIDFVNYCTRREHIENYVARQESISPLKGDVTGSEHMKPVLELISSGEQLPSVDYRMGIRLQNWVQQAGISMLKGKAVPACMRELDDLVNEERSDE